MNKLFLSLLFFASAASASPPGFEFYTASASGELTIGTDGRVLDVELSSRSSLGKGTLAGFESRVRDWRFEPILEDGRPVVAKGYMQLSLFALRKQGDSAARFGIRDVSFLDPPGAASTGAQSRIVAPTYPSQALRADAGARVMLLVKLDAEGRPARLTTERIELLGVSASRSQQAKLAAQFQASAERAAAKWSFDGRQAGELLRVPVNYSPGGMKGGWIRTLIQPVELDEWAVLELSVQQVVDLAADGTAVASRFNLITPLDPS